MTIAPYPIGWSPGQRFRFEQWLSLLPEGAVQADHSCLLRPEEYRSLLEPGGTTGKIRAVMRGFVQRVDDVIHAGGHDVCLVYREAFPFGPALFERLLAQRVPVVFDFDDAIWLADSSPSNRWVAPLKRAGKVPDIVRSATTTTVGNDYLAAHAKRWSGDVRVVPTTVDVDAYSPRSRPPNPRPVIGWSGSPTTSRHLAMIAPALRRISQDTAVDVHVLGDPRFSLEGVDRAQIRPWCRDTEIDDVAAFDVGLMPLPDEPWSRGKCGFKALLYMSLGVPVVASPVGVNAEIIEHGRNGLLASTEDDWVTAIATLLGAAALRRELAEAGRQTVVDRYAGQRWAPAFLQILRDAASRS